MKDKLRNPFSTRELPVLVTVDVCDGSFDAGERRQRFNALMDLLPGIRERLGEVIGEGGGGLPVTWFVRADMQVKEITGNTMGLYHGWKDFWDGVRRESGEVAWHPHLYKPHGRKWKPIRDPRGLRTMAEKIRHEISGQEWKPKTCRMGESVGSNELIQFLDTIGILADSSALPGRVRDDGQRWFDWTGTPMEPYRPASGDYRRPSRARGEGDRVAGEQPLKILEIPFTMAGVRAPYDSPEATRLIRRYVDLSFDPDRLAEAVRRIVQKIDYLMTVIHPLQASGMEIPGGGLVAGGLDVMSKNLRMILGSIGASNRIPRFITVEAFARAWLGIAPTAEAVKEDEKVAEKRESRIARPTGGTQRTRIETDRTTRMTTRGGFKAGTRPRRRGPQKRRG